MWGVVFWVAGGVIESRAENFLKGALVWLAALYIICYFLLGFLVDPSDYQLAEFYEIAWKFWRFDGGLPHFNPYLSGGRSLGADPQIPIFSPFVLLVPVLGAVLTIKLEMLLQLALGAYGLERWLQLLGVERPGRLWGSMLFLGGGSVVARFMVGHFALAFFFTAPLFLYLSARLDRSKGRERHLLRALVWLLFVYSALYKPHFIIYGAPLLLVETVVRSLLLRRWMIAGEFCVALCVAIVTCAVAYLPSNHYFAQYPRIDSILPGTTAPYTFLVNLVMPLKTLPEALYGGTGWFLRHEYSVFLGPVALWFACLGFVSLKRRYPSEAISLFVLCVFSVWLGLGEPSRQFSLVRAYSWLYSWWPGFSSIRVPPRFWYGAFLALVVFSAAGFRIPSNKMSLWLLALLGILPILINATGNLPKPVVRARASDWKILRNYSPDFEAVEASPNDHYSFVKQGKSVLKGNYNMEVHQARELRQGRLLQPELSTKRGTRLTKYEATWDGWSAFRISAIGETPFVLALNLNHAPYWQYRGSGKIVSTLGSRLTLESDGLRLEGKATFRQPLVREATLISALGLILVLAYLAWSWLKSDSSANL